jgi:hypothetical protein
MTISVGATIKGRHMRISQLLLAIVSGAAMGGAIGLVWLGARSAFDILCGMVIGVIPGAAVGIVGALIVRWAFGNQRWPILIGGVICSGVGGGIGAAAIVAAFVERLS